MCFARKPDTEESLLRNNQNCVELKKSSFLMRRIEDSVEKRHKKGANGLEIVSDLIVVTWAFCGNSWS